MPGPDRGFLGLELIMEPPANAAVAFVARRATAGLITLDRSLEVPVPIKGLASQAGPFSAEAIV